MPSVTRRDPVRSSFRSSNFLRKLPTELLCWWILIVPEVALDLVFLSIVLQTSCTDEC